MKYCKLYISLNKYIVVVVNDKTTASCQTNVSEAFGSLWSWAPEHYMKPYLLSLDTKLARDAGNK